MHGDQDSMDIEVIEDTEKAEIEANDVSQILVRTKQLTWYFGKSKLLRTKLKKINKTTTHFLHYRRHQNNHKRTSFFFITKPNEPNAQSYNTTIARTCYFQYPLKCRPANPWTRRSLLERRSKDQNEEVGIGCHSGRVFLRRNVTSLSLLSNSQAPFGNG